MSIEYEKVKDKKGKTKHRYRVRVRKSSPSFSREKVRTFADKGLGKNWANSTESDFLKEYEHILTGKDLPVKNEGKDITLAEYLQAVLDDVKDLPLTDSINKGDRVVIKKLINRSLGEIKKSTFCPQDIIDFLTFRIKHDSVTRATNHSDMNGLTNALKWQQRIELSFPDFLTQEFKKNLYDLKLTGKSSHRDYRATPDEFCDLYRFMIERDIHPRSKIRYRHLMLFAVYSTFRLDEICRLKWSEFNHETGRILPFRQERPKQQVRQQLQHSIAG